MLAVLNLVPFRGGSAAAFFEIPGNSAAFKRHQKS